ncbi:hypothetical protein [Neomegalonema sp.]|uniref:hypothetical protein n=1 Tax=Neomegalonema sp. TaxID=2039713 RepID=UPI00262F699A|nr:hypothetical protein [Neomegalonema sp.]MDD2868440.1 hypothetical protein [Neomegalonema sp.]
MAHLFGSLDEIVFWLAMGYGVLAALDMILRALGRGLRLIVPNMFPVALLLLFLLQSAVLETPSGEVVARLALGFGVLAAGFLLYARDRSLPAGVLKGFAGAAPFLGWERFPETLFAFGLICLAGGLCALAIERIRRA